MVSEGLKKYVNDIIIALKDIDESNKPIDFEIIDALFQASTMAMYTENEIPYSLNCSKKAKELLARRIYNETEGRYSLWDLENVCSRSKDQTQEINLFYKILKQEAYHDLQSYIYFMEKNRAPEKRFYLPRRKTLRIVLNDLMDLEKGKYKFYGLSMPPRVGKSTLCIFFLSWVMFRHPNAHNAMCGHSGVLAKGF